MAPDREADTKPAAILVWDAPTALVFVSWLSADQGYMTVHLLSGLTLLALLLFRLAWGFFGSTTARFGDFLHAPPRVLRYLRGRGQRLHAGHNPAGGAMVMVLIAVLLAQAVTVLFATDSLHFTGPLALLVSEDASLRLTTLHGTIFNLILLLVWLHVVAVGLYLLVKGDNLIRPMVTGRKPASHVPDGLRLVFTHPVIAVLLLAVSIALVTALFFWGTT